MLLIIGVHIIAFTANMLSENGVDMSDVMFTSTTNQFNSLWGYSISHPLCMAP
jgi:hypothetical protein